MMHLSPKVRTKEMACRWWNQRDGMQVDQTGVGHLFGCVLTDPLPADGAAPKEMACRQIRKGWIMSLVPRTFPLFIEMPFRLVMAEHVSAYSLQLQ